MIRYQAFPKSLFLSFSFFCRVSLIERRPPLSDLLCLHTYAPFPSVFSFEEGGGTTLVDTIFSRPPPQASWILAFSRQGPPFPESQIGLEPSPTFPELPRWKSCALPLRSSNLNVFIIAAFPNFFRRLSVVCRRDGRFPPIFFSGNSKFICGGSFFPAPPPVLPSSTPPPPFLRHCDVFASNAFPDDAGFWAAFIPTPLSLCKF